MIAISMQPSKKDIATIQRGMARAARELGQDANSALDFAARLVAQSAAAATVEAKPYRKYTAEEPARRGVKRAFRVRSDKTGKTFTVRAESVRELKTMPQVRIGYRGAARRTWQEVGGKLGAGRAASNATRSAIRGARRAARVDRGRSRLQPSITLTNSVGYALEALKGGPSALDGIVGKAGRRMHRMINAAVRKRMGAK